MDRSILYSLECLGSASVTLKDEQTACVKAIYEGKDVFLWLPTGLGKSFITNALREAIFCRYGDIQQVCNPTWKILADCCLAKQTNSRTTSY